MPITKTMAYKVGEETFATIAEAQIQAIVDVLANSNPNGKAGEIPMSMHPNIASMILEHADELISILTCKPEHEKPSRKPRSDKGTKRAKAEAINRALQDGKQ